MDESLKHFNPNPTLSVNCLSKLFFSWLNPLFKKGRQQELDVEDMFNVTPQDSSDHLGESLQREWDKEVKKNEESEGKTKPSLLKALMRLFGLRYLLLGLIVFIEEAVRVVQPLLLGGLIRFFTPNSQVSEMEAYLYAMGVSLCAIIIAVAHQPYFFAVTRMGMQMRVACCSLMFKKALKLSNSAMGETTVGQIVNLMSNDVNRFDQAVIFLHFLWIGPLQAIAVLVILWYELGPSVLAGFAVLLLLIPVQGSMGKLFSKLRRKTAVHTDERVKVMNEIIAGMRVIKMYCWEKPFGEVVEKIRSLEVKRIRSARYLQALILAPNFFSIKLVLLLTFVAYVLLDGSMISDRVFVTIAVYQAIRIPITVFMPFAVQNIAEVRICFDRVQGRQYIHRIKWLLFIALSHCARHGNWSELKRVLVKNLIFGISIIIWDMASHILFLPALVCLVVVMREPLLSSALFVSLHSFYNLGFSIVECVTSNFIYGGELWTMLIRMEKFLLLDELDKDKSSVERAEVRPKLDDCKVVINNLTAKWNPEVEQNTLEEVTATVSAGKLLAVIGPVGSGKSSLLMAILGELQASSGNVLVNGKVAYVSQQAWVFSGSVRQNILFGLPYDKARFDKAVRASAMHRDLEIMPHGDSTLIGDRGVSLSGGQRARVSLARALYTDADIFLLDDPLSAVDAAVGRHIFEKCIQGVLRSKPRILVTHQLQYLTSADSILILNEGKAVGMGTYEELSNSGIDFAELLKTNEEEEEEEVLTPGRHLSSASESAPILRERKLTNHSSTWSLASATSDFEPEPVQLPEEEERQKGTVGIKVYVEYFKNGAGFFKFILLIFLNLVAQGTYIFSDWWLSRWANSEEQRIAALKLYDEQLSLGFNQTNITIPYVDSYRNIYIFTGIIVAVFIFGMFRALLFFKIAVDASQKMHNSMFTRILRSPIGFFDTNPVGRILNRFAKDVGHMDDNLPITFFDFVQCFLMIMGIVLVAGVVNPWVFIPTTPLVLLFFYIRSYYLSTSRCIKRLEGTCRSPVFSYLSASLQGLHTIRAFGMEGKCQEEFDAHQNLHSEAWFLFLSTSRWLATRLDWLCALFVTAVTFCAVFTSGTMDAGLVGLSITYAMTLMGMFQWGVRQSAEVENQMISVERVLEYSKLPTEAALESDEKRRPPDGWPKGGAIQADNMCLQYFPSAPTVLKDLTFRIKEKEKVGIVGRTGAGKSSLITCLFRLVEPTGHLSIDGIDILHVGLHDLRKTISIIPQDPVLFTGTLRRNLDPFMHHEDEQLWKALGDVQLKSAVEDLPSGLETSVSEGGVNFSVGQRQLICLARAILRRNRILLIDEATANVDPKTDELIQETIRDKFCDCTVLTIAHRLHTIMDSDRVMVLSDGRIKEFEAPHLLLQRGSGLLYDMVQQMGKADADYLAGIAEDAYKKNRGLNDSPTNSEKIVNDSRSNNAAVKPTEPLDVDSIDLEAPLALAESFHSLLKSESGHKQEEDKKDDKKGIPSPEADEDVARTTEEQALSAPGGPDSAHKSAKKSTVTDTSLDDDDVFSANAESPIAARSNFQPAVTAKGDKTGVSKDSDANNAEDSRKLASAIQNDSPVLDKTIPQSEAETDDQTTHAESAPLLDKSSSRGVEKEAVGGGKQAAVPDDTAMASTNGDVETEDCSELDALIIPGSVSEANGSVRS